MSWSNNNNTNNNNNNNKIERITTGFLDHKNEKCCSIFPVQRPRHFRIMLSWITWAFLIFYPAVFFCGVAAFAITALEPAYSRIGVPGFVNDSAIFYHVTDRGGLLLRTCPGRVPYKCSKCDDGGGYGAYSKSEGNSTNAPVGKKPWPNRTAEATQNNHNEDDEDEPVFKFFSSSSSSSSRRRAEGAISNYSGHPNDRCECGAELLWSEYCPISEDLDCSKLNELAVHLYHPFIGWADMGLAFAVGWMPILVPMFAMNNNKFRYLRPITALIILFIVGFVGPLVVSIFAGLVMTRAKTAYQETTVCDDGNTLADRGYTSQGMFKIWQTAVASFVFLVAATVHNFCGLVYIVFFPKPKSGDDCCHTVPFRPSTPDCCCDEEDVWCSGCCSECVCCECCESHHDDDGICSCYNDWEEFDAREYPDNENNNNFPQPPEDNIHVVVGNIGNFQELNNNNNNQDIELRANQQSAVNGNTTIVNPTYPPSFMGFSGNSATTQHNRSESVNSDDNPNYVTGTSTSNVQPPPPPPSGYGGWNQPAVGVPTFGTS